MTTATQHTRTLTPQDVAPPWVVKHLQRRWGVGGIAGIIAILVGVFMVNGGDFAAHQKFYRAYLLGYMITLGLTLGSMVLLFLQHVTGGKWGLVIRRILEAGSRNLPLQALLFVPVAVGAGYLYPWAGKFPADWISRAAKEAMEFRGRYQTVEGFILRTIFFFIVWGILAYLANKWGDRQDQPIATLEEQNALRLRLMRLGGGGVVFYSVSISLAAIDLVMSLDAVYYSTIWGMIYMVGQALIALSFAIIILVLLAKYAPMKGLLRKTELHDNGKLLLAFVMLFTYLSFSQFIIIWSGNLPEEIRWYIARGRAGWKPVIISLFIFQFAVPFLLLLNRNLKKQGGRLARVAALLVAARMAELFWQIYPNFPDQNVLTGGHLNVNWMDFAIPLGMFCIWVSAFFYQLSRKPLIPVYHHLVPEILEHSHGTH
jgi:hypothetical protein